MDVMNIVRAHGVIPVLGLKDPDTAPQVAAALRKGVLPLLEITMRAEKAMDCLKAIKAADPDMLVGAGTILRCEQVDQAKAAGADYVGEMDLVEKIQKENWFDFDVVIASPT